MTTRRTLLISVLGAVLVTETVGKSQAAQSVVEVLALPHWPVTKALEPVFALLAKYEGRMQVIRMDVEGADGERRLKAIGLKGHVPIVLMIDGNRKFKRADESVVEFVNFPVAAGNPRGLDGAWSVTDFEEALRAALGDRADQK
jgi:hypothetical protein